MADKTLEEAVKETSKKPAVSSSTKKYVCTLKCYHNRTLYREGDVIESAVTMPKNCWKETK